MSKSRSKPSVASEKDDDKLQALVLADSFDHRFTPITLEAPRVLIVIYLSIYLS